MLRFAKATHIGGVDRASGRRNIKKRLALARDGTVDLWVLDEIRFAQRGSACRMWVAPEIKDPVLLHHPTRKEVGYFGAVRIGDGKFVYRREESGSTTETFFAFLKKLRRVACRTGRRVVLILDNVRYHHACLHRTWRDKHRKRFVLEFMPPYSPELNPNEGLETGSEKGNPKSILPDPCVDL
jgi:hypothetical protein